MEGGASPLSFLVRYTMRMPVYEDIPQYDFWLKAILTLPPLAAVLAAFALWGMDPIGAFVMLGTAVFIFLVFRAVMPKKYLIYDDHVRIVLGGPLGMNIPFSQIKKVQYGSQGWAPTVNFVTSFRGVVQIDKLHGMSIAITPARPDLFLEQLSNYLGADKIEGLTTRPESKKPALR